MLVIEIQTLIDITNTKVTRLRPGLQLEHDQYRNFITLKQCLEIRSNILFETDPNIETKDIKDLGFGTKHKGKHKVWTFRFSPEREGAYSDSKDPIATLGDDIHGVPIIQKLKESINIDKAIFDLKDSATKNSIIKALQGTI
ncbi:MAG: hypothetical protein EBU90_25445 [Proteobacteria bacterium]|nr:hypothetical protein [Pseudomonadota bacterium]